MNTKILSWACFLSEKHFKVIAHIRVLHHHPMLAMNLSQSQKRIHLLPQVIVELIIKLLFYCLLFHLLIYFDWLMFLLNFLSTLIWGIFVGLLYQVLITIKLVSNSQNVWKFLVFVVFSMSLKLFQEWSQNPNSFHHMTMKVKTIFFPHSQLIIVVIETFLR